MNARLVVVLLFASFSLNCSFSIEKIGVINSRLEDNGSDRVESARKLSKRSIADDVEKIFDEIMADEETLANYDISDRVYDNWEERAASDHSDHDGFSNLTPSPGKHFYIVSGHTDKVVEIPPGLKNNEGAKIHMWDKRGSKDLHQLWVVGEDLFIRSALERDMEFSNSSKLTRAMAGLTRAERMDLIAREGDMVGLEMHQFARHYKGGRWTWNGSMITSEDGRALSVRNGDPTNGARLVQADRDPKPHKKWKMVYVDSM